MANENVWLETLGLVVGPFKQHCIIPAEINCNWSLPRPEKFQYKWEKNKMFLIVVSYSNDAGATRRQFRCAGAARSVRVPSEFRRRPVVDVHTPQSPLLLPLYTSPLYPHL